MPWDYVGTLECIMKRNNVHPLKSPFKESQPMPSRKEERKLRGRFCEGKKWTVLSTRGRLRENFWLKRCKSFSLSGSMGCLGWNHKYLKIPEINRSAFEFMIKKKSAFYDSSSGRELIRKETAEIRFGLSQKRNRLRNSEQIQGALFFFLQCFHEKCFIMCHITNFNLLLSYYP